MNNQRRKPAQRLFRGLAGSPLSQPAQPESAIAASAQKSPAAIRAERFRERQKQNEQFSVGEAKRKRQERKQQREQRIIQDWAKQGFTTDLNELRKTEDRGGVFMSGAVRGKGKLVSGGYNSDQVELIAGIRTADAEMQELPLRAQLSDEELQQKLADASIDLHQKTEIILDKWKHDEEFCDYVKQLSLDELTDFVKQCSEDVEYARELWYEHTEHQACAVALTHVQPHGKQVKSAGHSSDEAGEDLSKETKNTFARKISFKRANVEIVQIGNRNQRFYNLQNGTALEHFEQFVREYTTPESVRDIGGWVTSDDRMVCKVCSQEIAPKFSIEAGFDHFGTEHRKHIVEHIRWYEAKAYRPKKRKCDGDHAGQIKRHGSGPDKMYCRKCNKLLYKPERSDAPALSTNPEQIAA